jgi:hypothetical protein
MLLLQLADVHMFNDDIYVFSSSPIIYFPFHSTAVPGRSNDHEAEVEQDAPAPAQLPPHLLPVPYHRQSIC